MADTKNGRAPTSEELAAYTKAETERQLAESKQPEDNTDADETAPSGDSTETTDGAEAPAPPTTVDDEGGTPAGQPVQNTTEGPKPTNPPVVDDPERFTDTTAGNETPDINKVVVAESTGQNEEVRKHNLGISDGAPSARPVGTLIKQKTLDELEDEIDSGEFKDITDFVQKHWEARDANVQLMSQVLRMEPSEVWQILKDDLGVQLPNGI